MESDSLISRAKRAWNVFLNRDPTMNSRNLGYSSYYRPEKIRLSRGNERSIVTSVYNRIAMDVAAVDILHVRLDENNRYIETMDSTLNDCLTLEANIDQTGRSFIQDVVMSMFDEGSVAIVPVDTIGNPYYNDSYKIKTMRVGKITKWLPTEVTVELYDDRSGKKRETTLPKRLVAIIENPLYSVMNEPNSTLQRLIRKLNLLDVVDEQNSSGKLDLIIQLPYIIKTEARRVQAENRRKDIEQQLAGSKYGIAYTDGTEHITQLNRPVENRLMSQIEYLTSMLYGQLGITQGILDGTADEKTMLNYFNRTIEPILSTIVLEMKRKFLSKTARSQRQSIMFFRDPFKLVPVAEIAEISDKMTRNEIMTSNEIRQIIGMKPSADPAADELRNKNLNVSNEEEKAVKNQNGEDISATRSKAQAQLDELDAFDEELDSLEEELNHGALMHYASEYYDPEKAHQYYEEHKKLKGRRSATGLNERGREAARYVKDQLTTERKTKTAANNEKTRNTIDHVNEQSKSERSAISETQKQEIAQIREQIKAAKKDPELKESLRNKIANLREENKKKREQIMEETRNTRTYLSDSNRAANKQLREEYDSKYEDELDRIKSTKEFQSTRKRRKR